MKMLRFVLLTFSTLFTYNYNAVQAYKPVSERTKNIFFYRIHTKTNDASVAFR